MACHPRRRPGLLDQALRTPASTRQRLSDHHVGRLSLHVCLGHTVLQGSVHGDAVPEEHVIVVEVGGE